MKLPKLSAIPLLILAIISVQGGAAIAKSIFPLLGALTTAGFRIILSAVLLLLVFRPNFNLLSKVQLKAVIPYGIALGSMNTCYYFAIERIPLGLATTLEFVGPLVLAVVNSKNKKEYVWILLAAFGVILISPWSLDSRIDLLGVFLALLSGGLWALFILAGGKVSKLMDSGTAASVGMLAASIVILPFMLIEQKFDQLTMPLFGLTLAIAAFSSAIPYTLELMSLKSLSTKTFSILMSLEPVMSALSGLVFLHEKLFLKEWIAMSLVLIASVGVALSEKKNKAVCNL